VLADILTFISAMIVLFGYIIQSINRFDLDETSVSIREFWINISLLSFLSVLSFGFFIYDLIKILIKG
jgi:lipid-A-disaccharide synthase-like uncharacterized protein